MVVNRDRIEFIDESDFYGYKVDAKIEEGPISVWFIAYVEVIDYEFDIRFSGQTFKELEKEISVCYDKLYTIVEEKYKELAKKQKRGEK